MRDLRCFVFILAGGSLLPDVKEIAVVWRHMFATKFDFVKLIYRCLWSNTKLLAGKITSADTIDGDHRMGDQVTLGNGVTPTGKRLHDVLESISFIKKRQNDAPQVERFSGKKFRKSNIN